MADKKQEYTNVAKNKIALMIRQKDFAQIVSISSESTRLECSVRGCCDIDVWGRVAWDNKD